MKFVTSNPVRLFQKIIAQISSPTLCNSSAIRHSILLCFSYCIRNCIGFVPLRKNLLVAVWILAKIYDFVFYQLILRVAIFLKK